ncbi:hypothetical protein [Alkalihalobacterium alkalinitrilicum]|uniref:hypothetical protein n=1 Tax=Alkalihalobacterium alkalinitrilicum TaxID=427920 RepID=UPI000995B453|nr:hypothetical protein [Alkalihalobacterium alkalinitrilicum]
MKPNNLSNKKLVEMFVSTVLKQNDISPKSQLSKKEKQEIKNFAKDIHDLINGFLVKKNKVNMDDFHEKQSVIGSIQDKKQIYKDLNDTNTIKIFTTTQKR